MHGYIEKPLWWEAISELKVSSCWDEPFFVLKSNFANPADDLYRNFESQLEPTDDEDDPSSLMADGSFETKQKINENALRRSVTPIQIQSGFKRILRSVDDATSMRAYFVDQIKDNSQMKNDSNVQRAEIPSSKNREAKLIKNMKWEFRHGNVNIHELKYLFPLQAF